MPVFRHFDYGRSAECAPSKNGDPSTPCIIVGYPRDNWPAIFITNPSRVSRTTRRYQQSRFQFGRPRSGRPRATSARNYTYLRAMARIWCHLTTRTVLIEWQPILILVVSISTIRWGMQKCHSMRKDEINCYIVFGWIGHLVEVQGKTDHHEYVNILQQHVLASSVDIFDNR